jgi:hypothetical protein
MDNGGSGGRDKEQGLREGWERRVESDSALNARGAKG